MYVSYILINLGKKEKNLKGFIGFGNKEVVVTFTEQFHWANEVDSNDNELKSKWVIRKQVEYKFRKLEDEGKKLESSS